MIHSTRNFILFGMLAVLCTGCSLERSWFQMSSNSPMPFFGLDFRLPRKTTSVEAVNHEQKLAQHWNSEAEIKTVSHSKDSASNQNENLLSKLPKFSDLTQREKTESLSFDGPKARFAP